MERRVWIKQIAIAGGGMLLLPACINSEGAISVTLKNISITDKEEIILAELAETIIPETETPGAKTLNLHQFLLKMVDDCYDHEHQKKFVNGLRGLNDYAKANSYKFFSDLSPDDKLTLLEAIEKEPQKKDLKYFLAETRRWTIKGYDTSEYFMTKVIPYELVPGRFHGCVKVFPAF